MRDYTTCVEACTQPVIHDQLKGTDWKVIYHILKTKDQFILKGQTVCKCYFWL